MVMVGSINVGKLRTPFVPMLETNSQLNKILKWEFDQPISIGQQIAKFHLGSSVGLFWTNKLDPEDRHKSIGFQFKNDQHIHYGEKIIKS